MTSGRIQQQQKTKEQIGKENEKRRLLDTQSDPFRTSYTLKGSNFLTVFWGMVYQ